MAMNAQWKSHEILNFIGLYQWILISWNFHRADQWKTYEKYKLKVIFMGFFIVLSYENAMKMVLTNEM